MFVSRFINHKKLPLMIDSGATHNFMTPTFAERLGLKVEDVKGHLAMNFVQGCDSTMKVVTNVIV